MKLVVQIPCYNEAATIGQTIREIPRRIPGINQVEVLVIDDASRDQSAQLAEDAGADRVVRLGQRAGLAVAFMTGVDNALAMGADLIVNTDADNQYPGKEIPLLVEPLLKNQADLVVGKRALSELPGYSGLKLLLQKLGSWFVGILAGEKVEDAPSGFRAMNREAALRMSVLGRFSYTIETLIQAGRTGMVVKWVPVHVNVQPGRRSRLYRNLSQYLARSVEAMLKTFTRYEPLRVFLALGSLVFTGGFGIGLWFLYYYFTAGGKGHVQMLILAAMLMIIGFQVGLIGLLADQISGNRKMLEELLYRVRKLEHGGPETKLGT